MIRSFDVFLGQISLRGAYCVECLSQLYGEPTDAVMHYINVMGLVGRPGQCRNCGEHQSTFRTGSVGSAVFWS